MLHVWRLHGAVGYVVSFFAPVLGFRLYIFLKQRQNQHDTENRQGPTKLSTFAKYMFGLYIYNSILKTALAIVHDDMHCAI